MCGILLKNKQQNQDNSKFKEALDLMSHRGPDHRGMLRLEDLGIDLGHRRLSILDTSESGNQPMRLDGVSLIFNGEIYNYRELKERFGIKTIGSGDSEVILKLYLMKGEGFVDYLDGEFAIVIVDSVKKKLFFTRDPLGVKPLYYYKKSGNIIISSEIKPILKFIPKEINQDSFQDFLLFGYSTFYSVFRDVQKCHPGIIHTIDLEKDLLTSRIYSQIDVNPLSINYDDAKVQLREKIISAVRKRMISDVPISSTLSGGLDSSIITGIMASLSKNPVKTYSISLGNQEEDLRCAKEVSKFYNTEHFEERISFEQAFEDLEKIISFAEEPMDKGSLIPSYYLAKSIKEKVTLIGEGADECFAGYSRHSKVNENYKNFSKYFNEFLRVFKIENVVNFHKWNSKNLNTALLYDLKNEIPEYHNMRIDKMFMSNSIEARVPYLDKEVVDFALGLPYEYKLNPEKKILRDAFKDMIPEIVFNRKKSALKIPYDEWIEKDKIKEVVLGSEILRKREIEELYSDKLIRNRSRVLWYIYLIETWKKLC